MDQPAPDWSARRPVMFGCIALILLLVGFGYWAVSVKIAGAIVAPGQITVQGSRQIVQHPVGGVVTEIHVHEGLQVRKGAVLMRLDDNQRRSDLSIIATQLFETRARLARLSAELGGAQNVQFDPQLRGAARQSTHQQEVLSGQQNQFAAWRVATAQRANQREKRIQQIIAQIGGLTGLITAQSRQLELVVDDLADQSSLFDRGLVQAQTVRALQREKARLTGNLAELTASKAQANERISEIRSEAALLRAEHREGATQRFRDLKQQEATLAAQHQAIARDIETLDLRAPVSGVVYGLHVNTPGRVVRAAEPLLYLVPQDRPLIVVTSVAPKHIDDVRIGQRVRVRLIAMDQRITPELIGHVRQISADVVVDALNGAPYFRIEVHIDGDMRRSLPDGARLLPGMPVEAYIQTSSRTPMAYLIKPLAAYFTRAFRES